MQEKHFNEIIQKGAIADFDVHELADRSKAETKLEPGQRTPTYQELQQIREFSQDYRRKNKKATVRQVRRAIEKKFGVKIIKNQ